jgi:hypothetical protein
VPRAELSAKNSIITHAASGRTVLLAYDGAQVFGVFWSIERHRVPRL